MAYYFLFPEIDTTLYSHPNRSELNAGSDEILEIVKERGTTDNLLYPTRVLIKFKNEEISNVVNETMGYDSFNDANTKVNLQLTAVEPKNLVSTLNLEAYPLSQSWDEGTGRYTNIPTSSNGASWKYRFNRTDATEWITSGFETNTTGSIDSTLISGGGGVWYNDTDFYATEQYLVGNTLDTNFEVKTIVSKWYNFNVDGSTYPTGIENNGFLIKKPNVVETDVSHSFGELQYFSVDTHTIHPPKLTFRWDDSTYDASTYNNPSLTSTNTHLTLYPNKEIYNTNEIAKFRIHLRDQYPTRTFVTSSNYITTNYLPSSSFYSIRDAHSEQEIIPFDEEYTKLSVDSDGNYFKIYMDGLQPERFYRILIKHKDADGTKVYDNNYYFKVVR
jgi:hypothetical protein